jgi:hypothetical protein
MRKAARTLGLEFVAIDYSTFATGAPVLWEANPYFYLPTAEKGVLPQERRLHIRMNGYYDAIGAFFSRLLEQGDRQGYVNTTAHSPSSPNLAA